MPTGLSMLFCSILSALPVWGNSEEIYRDNVVVVLDCSGSMGEGMRSSGMVKMDAAKSALKEVIAQAPANTQVGILTFSAKNIQDNWIYPLGPRDNERLMAAIDLPQPGGGTPLGAFLKLGADRLLEQRKEQYGYGSYRLLAVTDGQAGDEDLVRAFAPEIVSRGINLDVIGVDMAEDHLLAHIAHSYRRADDPDSLKTAIADVFAEVSQQDGSDASEDAFELLGPIPSGMAGSLLTALSKSGNEPIGSRQDPAAPPRQPMAQNVPPQQPQGGTSSSGGGAMLSFPFLIFVIVMLVILNASFRKMRRG